MALKVLAGVFGHRMVGRKNENFSFLGNMNLLKLIFIFDLLLHFNWTVGIYYEFDNFIHTIYIYNGHYVVIYTVLVFIMDILLFFSSLKRG